MKKCHLFALWGGLFALCAALGFIQNPSNALRVLMSILSVVFFIPGALLLHHSRQTGDMETAMLVRNFSAASLVLTSILLIANFLCVLAPVWLGNMLHSILIIVSSPMVCSGYWVLSLFFWACLMIVAIKILKTKKNP